MSFQVGILAELTWEVYSWDIVEPISYFIAYGTAMAFYAFHLMTRSDFEYMTLTDRLFLRKFYREARRKAFDISLYNRLKNRLFIVHTDLARLRSPLSLSLPAPPNPLKCKISGEELSPLDAYRARQQVDL
jgi:calcium uniporter regulatory subunit MCUb, mitochondrial